MDKKTAEKLYETCYMQVYSYVMTLAKDSHKAQEITQETFFKAMTTKQTFRGESECLSWLCAIAKNVFIDETRRNSRYQDEPDEPIADISTDIEQSITDSEKRIHRAKAYRRDPYLKNNVTLVNALDSVPYWLEKAHYAQLEKWVDNMANCTYMDEEEYDQQHNRVMERIDNYEESAYGVYGRSHSVKPLRSRMENLRDDYVAKKSSFSISIGGVDFRF